MRRRALCVSLVLVCSGVVAALAQNVTPACPPGITSISGCPLTGCGGVADALLNQAKNRSDAPASTTDITVADIKSLVQPTDWTTGQPRDSLAGHGRLGGAPRRAD